MNQYPKNTTLIVNLTPVQKQFLNELPGKSSTLIRGLIDAAMRDPASAHEIQMGAAARLEITRLDIPAPPPPPAAPPKPPQALAPAMPRPTPRCVVEVPQDLEPEFAPPFNLNETGRDIPDFPMVHAEPPPKILDTIYIPKGSLTGYPSFLRDWGDPTPPLQDENWEWVVYSHPIKDQHGFGQTSHFPYLGVARNLKLPGDYLFWVDSILMYLGLTHDQVLMELKSDWDFAPKTYTLPCGIELATRDFALASIDAYKALENPWQEWDKEMLFRLKWMFTRPCS